MLTTVIPFAVAAAGIWALVKWTGARPWHVIVSMIAGFWLASSATGPDISRLLSQLTGGYLH